jgi:uncharacterized protein (TIRG00374 family)
MSRRFLGVARNIFGYLLAAACLVWAFHGIHFERLVDHIAQINWWWVALGVFFDILSYVFLGLRWHLLLRPVGHVSVLKSTQAIYAGLFLNEVFPMRLGEFARAYLVSLWLRVEFVRIIPSMALERLTEGIWLAAGIGLTAIFVPLPHNLVRSFDILGIIVLGATVLFVFIIIRGKKMSEKRTIPRRPRSRILQSVASLIGRLGGGFRDIGISPALYGAFFCTLGMIGCQAVSFWLIMWAYGIKFIFWVGAAVFLIVLFGTAIPNAPANVGTYQFFCVLGLTIFGVDKTLAAGFSIVVFIILTLPLIGIGFFALGQSGVTLAAIKSKIKNLRGDRESSPL